MHLKPKQITLLIIGAVFLFLFFIFTMIVKKEVFSQLDFDITVKIQDKLPLRLDPLLSVFPLIGSFEIIIIPLIVLLVVLRKKLFGMVSLLFFVFAHITELIGKLYMTHPGPPFMFFRNKDIMNFPSNYIQPGSSYPSGHSFRAVFVAALFIYAIFHTKKLSQQSKYIISICIASIACVIVFAKVALGQHWTTDVVAGEFLGAGLAAVALIFY